MDLKQLTDLINAGDIDKAQEAFTTRESDVLKNLEQYEIAKHQVIVDINRMDKVITGKDGKSKTVKQWKIPIPFQKKIVDSAVAFLFGKPVRLIQESEGTDNAYEALQEIWKQMRMHSLNREAARILFSETEVARLFVPAAEDGTTKVKCVLLAQSLGDTLYTSFDNFGKLQAFARKYTIKEGEKDITHFDIYTADFIYKCTGDEGKWEVEAEENKIGKIPVSYYIQKQTEWADVQPMIERLEWLMSTRADVNDYSANPILILEGQVIDLPDKYEVAKVVQLENGGKASYLTPQMAIEMVKDERETLEEAIKFCTDTPDLTQKEDKSIGQQSGIALTMKFFPAILKAMNKQELWGEMLDREISIIKAILDAYTVGITDKVKGYKAQLKNLEIGLEFGNPLPDNVEEKINMLNLATGGKALMSQEAAVGMNPLVANPAEEFTRLQEETAQEQVTLTM